MRIFLLSLFVILGANLINESVSFATKLQEQKVSQLAQLYFD